MAGYALCKGPLTLIDRGVAALVGSMATLQSPAEVGHGMGMPRYIAATAEVVARREQVGSIQDLQRERQRQLAWEYAFGRDSAGRPWSISDLAQRTGLLPSTAEKIIDAGRAAWRAAGNDLPR
ncbi:hypothetical protein [Nonomuraea rosea]|uniref:hypothetical protein n=1 Tax=Nonomuraea rosea TaxID=638574 RepID=UPI0031E8FE89